MALSNADKEMLWVDSWNELYDLIEKHGVKYLLLENYQEVTLEGAQGFIQNSAYEGKAVEFKIDHYKGKKSILIATAI